MQKEKILGIELGSTRIKSVLIDSDFKILAQGSFQWENQLKNGFWTYSLDDVQKGLQQSFTNLCNNYKSTYNEELDSIKSLGFSAMMHGYLAFDKKGNVLVPFRTWRNTTTGKASEILTKEMSFNIPIRWSISHLYQAILDSEEHVKNIDYITTLAGYVHWKLTGEKVLGVGDASGMFPIDSNTNTYDQKMVDKFNALIKGNNLPWTLLDILPKVAVAGENGGVLTKDGISYLNANSILQEGIITAPPEGDAGTGMVATNAIAVKTGNVSAGTSVFAMIVLDKPLQHAHEEIDMVTSPSGNAVAMVHCNNCTSDINAWSNLLHQFSQRLGVDIPITKVYELMYSCALDGDIDCGGLLSYNYISGEPTTRMIQGRPLFMRLPDANFTFENFAKTHLYSSVATLKIGMDILVTKEAVQVDKLFGHGGFFTTKGTGQKIMADMLKTPVSVMETSGEGGSWGMAILSAFTYLGYGTSLDSFLENQVFKGEFIDTITPNLSNKGVDQFMKNYISSLEVEKKASETFIDIKE